MLNDNVIRITYDVTINKWDLWLDEKVLKQIVIHRPNELLWTDIELCFRQNGSKYVTFPDGFRFGIKVVHNGETIIEDKWPQQEGVRYHSSDQDVMQHIRVDGWVPGETYKISVWCVCDDETYDYTYDFVCPGYSLS